MFFYQNRFEYIQVEKEKLNDLMLSNIPERGIITRVLLSEDQRTTTNIASYSVTKEVDEFQVTIEGIKGERHWGMIASSGRERAIYPKGTQILGQRQIFAVSPYDCRVLSEKIGVEVTPELLGANLVIEREDRSNYSLSELPHGTYLCIAPQNAQELPRPPIATLIHHVEQQGCGVTGAAIAAHYSDPLLVRKFTQNSKTNRGIVCRIEYPVDPAATLQKGQIVFFKFPQGISP
ncbi:MAG: hypothetical protein AABY00_03040 [Nanoarchaeota archaeon]